VTSSGSPFRFRLERVRALRERREDLAREELAHAMMRRSRCEEELRDAEQALENARIAQRTAHTQGGNASALDLRTQQAYIERLEQVRNASIRNLELHETEVQDRLDALSAAARDRHALERLKERKQADFQRESDRLEGRMLDEIAINRYRSSAA
jgi:flagellar FliJ protein